MIKFTTLCSGSTGNCVFVSDGESSVLVDVGKSAKSIEDELKKIGENPAHLNAVLVTHDHIDHVRGVSVLVKKRDIPVYASSETVEQIKNPDEIYRRLQTIEEEKPFAIGNMIIKPIGLSHDAAPTFGFSFTFPKEGKRIVVATDTGKITEELSICVETADLVYIESNYDPNMLLCGRYPYFLKRRIAGERGHLSNADCGQLCAQAVRAKAKHLVLGHLSRENNMPELAYMTCQNILREKEVTVGKDCTLVIAQRDGAGQIITF